MEVVLTATIAVLAAVGPAAAAETGAERPNLVVILADDLGYGEPGCYGGTQVATPHIDALAAAGTRFTAAYSAAPVCAPSRAGFISGRYPQATGIERNRKTALPAFAEMPTIAEALKALGYRTAAIGKWHLGYGELAPAERGFDHFYGFMPGMWNYFRDKPGKGFWGARHLVRNGTTEEIPADGYTTDLFTDDAIAFIAAGDEPFFLYLAHQTPHTPLQAPPRYLERVPEQPDDEYTPEPRNPYQSPHGKARTYLAMIASLDESVGRIMATLAETGHDRDTLVIFWSDNGGVRPGEAPADNGPLRGHKQSLYEGGIRIPFIAHWPTVVPAGTTSDAVISAMDIMPTILALCGALADFPAPLDGRSLVPVLRGEAEDGPHEALFWRFPSSPILERGFVRDHGQGAMRRDRWKMYLRSDGSPELYDLEADLAESRDLAAERPELAAELVAAWRAWNETMPPVPSQRDGDE